MMGTIPFDSRLLRRRRRPVGRLDTELLGVLRVQPLPAELHGLGADDRSNRLTREEPLKDVEANVPPGRTPCDKAAADVGPQRQARAATKGSRSHRLSWSPQLYS